MFTALDPELLRPAIEKHRDAAEQLGRAPDELVAELRAHGAFRLLTPRERGGYEAGTADALDFYARLARIDGPAAWLVWNFNLGFAAGWLPQEAADRIWAGGTDPLTANSGSPGGLTAVDGGYRLTGRWKIVSGAHLAEWFLVAGVDPASGPRFCAVPRADVTVEDTWDVVGMRASDSNTVVAGDVFVPEHMTVALDAPNRIDRPAYRVPTAHLLFPGCAAVLIGMAQAAVDELTGIVATKTNWDGSALAGSDRVHRAVGRALAQVEAARGHLIATHAALDEAAAGGRAPTGTQRAATHGAVALVTETARDVLVAMYELGSSAPLYRTNRLGRIFRDGMAAAQAANLSTQFYAIPGRVALDQPAGFPFG